MEPPPWVSNCGNGVIESSESCEPMDLNGSTCASLGYKGGGALSCSELCIYDVSLCRLEPAETPPIDAGAADDDAGESQP